MDNRSLLSGMAIGAALALAFDPDQGTRRRALIRDKVFGGRRYGGRFDAAMRHVSHRACGIITATRSRLWAEEADDRQLLARVRSRIGRVCSHPRAIDVYVHDGEVTLLGPVMADEVRSLLTAAASVRGVHSVVNDLEPHESAEGVPALQGGSVAGRSGVDVFSLNWTPGAGALVGAAAIAGSLAFAYSRR